MSKDQKGNEVKAVFNHQGDLTIFRFNGKIVDKILINKAEKKVKKLMSLLEKLWIKHIN